MANPEHVAKLNEGVKAWNEWRSNNPLVVPDLSLFGCEIRAYDDANFAGANLRHASLVEVNFNRTDFSNADMSNASMSWGHFGEANFQGANLDSADLTSAWLVDANLRDTKLWNTIFRKSDLERSDLSGAKLRQTIFADLFLSETVGLEMCAHSGPSSLGIDTLFKSRGEISEAFLRGCGVPEQMIVYARSLVNQPIQFYSCFISYSTKDQEFADRLYADLQNNGVRCWFAPHDIAGGKKVHEQIDEAIRMYDRLLLILSEHSMKSNWVETEISKARKREQGEGRQMLFPLRLVDFETLRAWECFDADTGKDSAREIREYFIPDFSNWKDHDSYKVGFDRLLRDLKSKGEPAGKPALS